MLDIVKKTYGIEELSAIASRSQAFMGTIQRSSYLPDQNKKSPLSSVAQVARIAGIDGRKLANYLKNNPTWPQGSKIGNGRNRYFSVEETAQIFDLVQKKQKSTRFKKKKGTAIAINSFKGGIGKTMVSSVLAQGLAMRGLKVLAIDGDAQGNLTQMMGFWPDDSSIPRGETLLQAFLPEDDEDYDSSESLLPCCKPTYFHNVDLIGATNRLHELEISIIQTLGGDVFFWEPLVKRIEELKEHYDVIIFDLPPQFSFSVLAVLYASDCIICPVPPKPLEISSSAGFWDISAIVMEKMEAMAKEYRVDIPEKRFESIDILMTRVDTSHKMTPTFAEWIQACYPGHVLPYSIPESRSVANAMSDFSTILDQPVPDGSYESYNRVREPIEALCDHMYTRMTTGEES